MPEFKLKTPVAFIIFNRPDITHRVFEEIRRAKPPRLFIVADGPRSDVLDDADKCKATRSIIDMVDWPCEVMKDYSDHNLGCKRRVSSGLDWVFDNSDEAIILEDDCVPDTTFFRFCEEMLERYKDDKRVMAVSGNNFWFGKKRTNYSYFFSRYPRIWGWATWASAWKHFDIDMKSWPEIRDGGWLDGMFNNKHALEYRRDVFEKAYSGELNVWGASWLYSCWVQNSLTIVPNVNLVTNIGFGDEATHTKGSSKFDMVETAPMEFPLIHPPFILRDVEYDRYSEREVFSTKSIFRKAVNKLSLIYNTYKQGRGK